MLKVPYGQDPYSVIGKYIRDHITAIEDIIAVIGIDDITTNQLLMVDMNEEDYFIWNNDWYEGEKDVALIDFFPVSEAINPSAQPEPCDDPRADVYYLAEKIGIHQLYALVVELRGEPEPCEDAVSRQKLLNDLKELKIAWEKYPVMAKQIKGVETAIEYVEAIPSVTPKPEPCEDAVSRKDAIIQLSHNKNGDPDCDVIIQHDIETLKRLPSVMSKRKTGKWIHEIVNDYTEKTYCSECGESAPFVLVSDDYYGVHAHGEDRKTDFCPNCGAKMEV